MPQQIPEESLRKIWEKRYRSILDLEKHLHRNGTYVVKFFLHLSRDEQRRRFLERIDNPEKNWKFSRADLAERKFWNDYMKAYEDCLKVRHRPCAVVYCSADDKENARLIISQITPYIGIAELSYPGVEAHRRELQSIRKLLTE